MNFTFRRWLCSILMLLILAACTRFIQPSADLGEISRDSFMSAMRWKRYQDAASLMIEAHQQDFMQTFRSLKDIQVVDIRAVDVKNFDGNLRFDSTIEMDYYLLPSPTVKTFSFKQSWEFFTGENSTPRGYMIVTPFPDFP